MGESKGNKPPKRKHGGGMKNYKKLSNWKESFIGVCQIIEIVQPFRDISWQRAKQKSTVRVARSKFFDDIHTYMKLDIYDMKNDIYKLAHT